LFGGRTPAKQPNFRSFSVQLRKTCSFGKCFYEEEKKMNENIAGPIETPPAHQEINRLSVRINHFFRRRPVFGILLALVLLITFFGLSAPGLLKLGPLTNVLSAAADIGVVAVGVGLLMISGEFDLSVGSVYLISTLIFVYLANAGIYPALAFIITLLVCALIGAINGIIVVRLSIPSFIVTMAAMMGYRGLHVILTNGFLVSYHPDRTFLHILAANLFSSFYMTIIWWVLIVGVAQIILVKTQFGNWVFAAGGNPIAARNIGVPVYKVKILNFALCSMLAGLGGIFTIARFYASQSQLGEGYEFEAITACVIGGILLNGGKGNIIGVFIGAIFVSLIRTGLISMGLNSYIYMPITGLLLLGAVILNRYLTKQ
jgi:simple sugar transport system permease protein